MSDLIELTNSPIEIEIGGRKLKVRKLSLEDVFASTESLVLSDHISRVMRIAGDLEGAEKIEYLRVATADLPSGEALQQLVQEKLSTISGVIHIFHLAVKPEHPAMTDQQIREIVKSPDDFLTITGLCEWFCGLSDNGFTEKKTVSPPAD